MHRPSRIYYCTHVHDPQIIYYWLKPLGEGTYRVQIWKSDQGNVWTATGRPDCTWFTHIKPGTIWITSKKNHPGNMDTWKLPHHFHHDGRRYRNRVFWIGTCLPPQGIPGRKTIITTDWDGKIYVEISLTWDYDKGTVKLTMTGYVNISLHSFQKKKPKK